MSGVARTAWVDRKRLRDADSHPAGVVLDTDTVLHRGSGEGWPADGDI